MDSFDPTSDRTIGYHLFLEPSGEIAQSLQASITTLARACGGPVFAPHVTVLARIPEQDKETVLHISEEFAQGLSPVILTLGALMSEHAYYRALYSKIDEQELMCSWYQKAAERFSMEVNPEYVAHLSLLYGNFSDEVLQKARNEVVLPDTRSFTVKSLHLYRTEGTVEDWYKIQEFSFGA